MEKIVLNLGGCGVEVTVPAKLPILPRQPLTKEELYEMQESWDCCHFGIERWSLVN